MATGSDGSDDHPIERRVAAHVIATQSLAVFSDGELLQLMDRGIPLLDQVGKTFWEVFELFLAYHKIPPGTRVRPTDQALHCVRRSARQSSRLPLVSVSYSTLQTLRVFISF